ncbi:hypothetical protein [Gallaecimonas xiamenensis]|uniref:hypothetical protein n=1 Tax=Gallaecimonas xiamenensis TaxID=1207039 RepID=UPI0012EAE698|nr:hypothetical protein [Gallaecimonas xiamenensis]
MTYLMRKDHAQAESKFKKLREIAYEITMEDFPEVQVSGVSYLDALEADRWKESSREQGRPQRSSWQWSKEYPHYLTRPNRFEITVRRGGILGGICLGQLSKHGQNLRLNLIESTPLRPTPLGLRALPIISYTAAVFADIVGAKELWVIDPLPALEGLYCSEGFGSREYYHGKRVGQRRIL